MALSTLKVNRITSRALITKIQIDNDLDLNGSELLNVAKITTGDISAPAASTLKAGLMSDSDKSKLDNIEANADVTGPTNVEAAGAVMDSDFEGDASKTVGHLRRAGTNAGTGEPDYVLDDTVVNSDTLTSKIGLLRSDGSGAVSFDNNTYLVNNQAIACTGQVEGTGSNAITLNLTSSAITSQPPYTAVDGTNDRLLVAVQKADGSFSLGQVAPNAVGGGGGSGGSVGSFNSGKGIGRIAGETGTSVTLELNQFGIQHQTLMHGDGTNPQIEGADEILLGKPNVGMLAKTTMNHLGTWISTNFASGGGGGGGGGGTVNVTGLAVEFDIDGDGNLTLTHTGGLTSSQFYIDSNSELVAVVT
jgi:hypothetical protein